MADHQDSNRQKNKPDNGCHNRPGNKPGEQGAEKGNFCALSINRDEMPDVVMVGYAGLEASVLLAQHKQQELLTRYSSKFLRGAAAQKQELITQEQMEAAAAGESGVSACWPLGRAGVFMGLWNMAQDAGVGLEILQKQIPIRQETVEISNFFDVDPYQLRSGGAYLIFARQGYRLVQTLRMQGLPAAVIGMTMPDNDRVIVRDGERRFLEKKYQDPLEKLGIALFSIY